MLRFATLQAKESKNKYKAKFLILPILLAIHFTSSVFMMLKLMILHTVLNVSAGITFHNLFEN